MPTIAKNTPRSMYRSDLMVNCFRLSDTLHMTNVAVIGAVTLFKTALER